MAERIAAVTDRETATDLAADMEELLGYMSSDLEMHLEREEVDVFPRLAARGLEPEVAEAIRQHEALRILRYGLIQAPADDLVRRRALLRDLGTALANHLRYEADFLYVDLLRSEIDTFRERLDVLCAALHAHPGSI
jgi:hypothetical protein